MNQEEKKRIRLIGLVLLGLSLFSLLFVVWNYRIMLSHDENAVFDRLNSIGSFVASQVDTADFSLLSTAVNRADSPQKLSARESAAAARMRSVVARIVAGLPENTSLRLMTKSNLSTYEDRHFIDIMQAVNGALDYRVTVPATLWDRYAAVDLAQFRGEEGNDTLSVFAPVMDASHRVVGHILIQYDFQQQVSRARQHLFYKSGIFLLVLLLFGALLGYLTYQLMRYHINERFTEETKLTRAAELDAMTGLYHRSFVMDQIGAQLKVARATAGSFAVMMLDLDNFKRINDLHGSHIGDKLITLVGRRIRNTLSKSDIVGRAGGDEFIVLLRDVRNKQYASAAAERIVKVVGTPFLIKQASQEEASEEEEKQFEISISIGLCFYPEDGNDAVTLIRSAATALSHAKMSGKNGHQLFDSQMSRLHVEQLRIERDLQRAQEQGELKLWYQPKFDLDKKLVGMEALLRWVSPDGIIPPTRFIPVAENSGQIIPIGFSVIDEAAKQLATWHRQGYKALRMSVNISPKQFNDDTLVSRIKEALERHSIPPSCFEVEITESVVMDKKEVAVKVLTELSKMGVKIAIDDFGMGYSSLSQFQHLPIDVLKVDKSFIDDVPEDDPSVAVTNTIIILAKNLKKSVVAEGVENERQLQFLRERGCDVIQGYLFGKPLPPDDFTDQFIPYAEKTTDD